MTNTDNWWFEERPPETLADRKRKEKIRTYKALTCFIFCLIGFITSISFLIYIILMR